MAFIVNSFIFGGAVSITSIQEFSINMGAPGGNTATATISAVTTANAYVLFNGQDLSASVPEDVAIRLDLTNTTTVTATRESNGSVSNAVINGVVVELSGADIESIQQGTIALSGSTETNTDTISAVDAAKTFVSWLGVSSASSSTVMEDIGVRLDLTNTTTVTATRDSPATRAVTVGYVAVEFK